MLRFWHFDGLLIDDFLFIRSKSNLEYWIVPHLKAKKMAASRFGKPPLKKSVLIGLMLNPIALKSGQGSDLDQNEGWFQAQAAASSQCASGALRGGASGEVYVGLFP